MIKSPSSELEDMQNQFAGLSLAGATTAEIANHILDQILAYFEKNNAILHIEGIYRLSGNEKDTKEYYEKVKNDPNSMPLETSEEFIKNPHNIIGVLKKSLFDTSIEWSQEALKILIQFQTAFHASSENKNALDNASSDVKSTDPAPKIISKLIEDLTLCGAAIEAKLLHNMMHLGYLICQHQDINKMTADNMAILIAPSLSAMTKYQFPVHPSLSSMALIDKSISKQLIEISPHVYHAMIIAISSKEHFGLSFEQQYPTAAQSLLKVQINKFSTPKTNPPPQYPKNKPRQTRRQDRGSYRKSISLYNPKRNELLSASSANNDIKGKEYYPSQLKRSPSYYNAKKGFLETPTITIQETKEEENHSLSPKQRSPLRRILLRKSNKGNNNKD